jgi:ADP-ribose pyrophosphatase YjhB (NUDIX family)
MNKIIEVPIPEAWEVRHRTLAIVIKGQNQVLLGLSAKGRTAGYFVPPGGKIEENETVGEGCTRELLEESGLKGLNSREIAEVTVRIEEERVAVVLHVFRYSQWRGKIKHDPREFEYLKFVTPYSRQWRGMLPGDSNWMSLVIKGVKLKATIFCGKNRKDFREVEIARWT